jgi:hypothetical protein
MAGTPRQSRTTGVLHIARLAREGDRERPFDYLISFGGSKDPVGAYTIAKALGTEDLVRQLQNLGVSADGAEMAAKALADQPQHRILGVSLTRDQLQRLAE